MGFVERVGAAVVSPRRALAEADAARGGSPDAAALLALKFVCGELRAVIVAGWTALVAGPAAALGALGGRLGAAIGRDLVILFAAGVIVTIGAGRRRSVGRDFDLGTVAWVPFFVIDVTASLVATIAGRQPPLRVAQAITVVALGWCLVVLALAIQTARGRTGAAPTAGEPTAGAST